MLNILNNSKGVVDKISTQISKVLISKFDKIKISILSKSFLVAFILISSNLFAFNSNANNECGILATTGGSLICNGDGTPSTDLSIIDGGPSHANGINYNLIGYTLNNGFNLEVTGGVTQIGPVNTALKLYVDSTAIGDVNVNLSGSGTSLLTSANNTFNIVDITSRTSGKTYFTSKANITIGQYDAVTIDSRNDVKADIGGNITVVSGQGIDSARQFISMISLNGKIEANISANITATDDDNNGASAVKITRNSGGGGSTIVDVSGNIDIRPVVNSATASIFVDNSLSGTNPNFKTVINLSSDSKVINGGVYLLGGGGYSAINVDERIDNGFVKGQNASSNSKLEISVSKNIHSMSTDSLGGTVISLGDDETSSTAKNNSTNLIVKSSATLTSDNQNGINYSLLASKNDLLLEGTINSKEWGIIQSQFSNNDSSAVSAMTIKGTINSTNSKAIRLDGATGLSPTELAKFNNSTTTIYSYGTISGDITGQNGKNLIYLYNGSTTSGKIEVGANQDYLKTESGSSILGITTFDGGADFDTLIIGNSNVIISAPIENWEDVTFEGNNVTLAHNFDNNLTSGSLTLKSTSSPLTINGANTYTQGSGNSLKISAIDTSNYGRIAVGGTANISSGATIDVTVATNNSFAKGQTLNNVISSSGLTASSLNITDSSSLFDFAYIIDGSTVDLRIATSSSTVYKSSYNNGKSSSLELSKVIDDLIDKAVGGDMGKIISALGSLTTEKEVANAAEQMTPILNVEAAYIAGYNDIITKIINDRVSTRKGFNSGDILCQNQSLWVKPFGSIEDQKNQGNIKGYSQNLYGIAIGGDQEFSDQTSVGASFAVTNGSAKTNSNNARQTLDFVNYKIRLYGSHDFDDGELLIAQIGAGTSQYTSNRFINFANVNRLAKADYTGYDAHATVKLQKKYDLDKDTNLVPFVKAQYAYSKINDYKEDGADSLNLNVDSNSDSTLLAGVGAKILHNFSNNLSASADTGISYDFMADTSKITANLEGGGAQFSTQGIKPSPLIYNIGFAGKYLIDEDLEISANYDLNARTDYISHSVLMNLKLNF